MDRNGRPQGTRTPLRVAGAVATVLVVGLATAPAASAARAAPAAIVAPAATPAGVAASVSAGSAADDATTASRDARVLRRETAALLAGYLADYGDRFTTDENDQLRAYRAEADRTLAGVVLTTRRLQALVAERAPRYQILAAGRAAQRAHGRARQAAEASYDGARRIMEPRLSLFEGLAAIRDYDAMLDRFDDLGNRIDSVVERVD